MREGEGEEEGGRRGRGGGREGESGEKNKIIHRYSICINLKKFCSRSCKASKEVLPSHSLLVEPHSGEPHIPARLPHVRYSCTPIQQQQRRNQE